MINLLKNKGILIFLLILFLHVSLRFYELEKRSVFGWDQVINAWTAKDILIDHKLPLVGMQAKLNSGFYIGPLYSYINSLLYFFTKLDPIAAPIFAGLVSIFSYFVLFFVIKNIFSEKVALVAVFINTVAFYTISLDRIPWPVNFIVPLSSLILFSLYKIINGNVKYLLLLSLCLGLSLHVHFTSVFYFPIIILSLPFFPRNKKTLKYLFFSFPIFLILIFPIIIHEVVSKASSSKGVAVYLGTYSHGFHLRRFLQIAKDAFIEVDSILDLVSFMKITKYFLFPFFIFIYFREKFNKKKLIVCFLMVLWLLIPWISFSIYSGEISNYYFSITRPIILMVLSFLFISLFFNKWKSLRYIGILLLVLYAGVNVSHYLNLRQRGMEETRREALQIIKSGKKIKFAEGDPNSFFYFIYKQCDFCRK